MHHSARSTSGIPGTPTSSLAQLLDASVGSALPPGGRELGRRLTGNGLGSAR